MYKEGHSSGRQPLRRCVCLQEPCIYTEGFAVADLRYGSPPNRRGQRVEMARSWRWRPFGYCAHRQSRRASGSFLSCCVFWPDCVFGKWFLFLNTNTLYIQPTVQLTGGWFSFSLFPSRLCKTICTTLDPHLLPSFWCRHMFSTGINHRNWYLRTAVVSLFLGFIIHKLARYKYKTFFFF